MNEGHSAMHRRINITLPEETVKLIDRVSEKGDRSQLINEAIRRYVKELGRAKLRARLREGYLRNASQDLQLAAEWFSLDDQTWPGER